MRRIVIVDASIVRPPTVSFAQLFTAPRAPSDESSAMVDPVPLTSTRSWCVSTRSAASMCCGWLGAHGHQRAD